MMMSSRDVIDSYDMLNNLFIDQRNILPCFFQMILSDILKTKQLIKKIIIRLNR